MLTFIFRVLIVCVVFIAGAFVGNIYMPQKTLEESYIAALDKPQTSLTPADAPGLQPALNSLDKMLKALSQTQIEKETLFTFEDTLKKQLYAEAFRSAEADYKLQLLKVQKHPERYDDFMKARNRYYELSTAIAKEYPPHPKGEIIILDTPATDQVSIKIPTPAPSAKEENKAEAETENKTEQLSENISDKAELSAEPKTENGQPPAETASAQDAKQ